MAETETTAHAPTVEDAAEHAATTVASGGEAHTEAAAEHSAGGLPQFEFQHWGGQIGYLLILFALLYILISRVFAPRIRRVFDERRAAIEGALSSARSVQAEAQAQADAARQALADARGKAGKTAADAKAKATAEAAERQAAVEAELQDKLAKAEASIRKSRDKAMTQVRGIATETAQALVEKLTGAKPADEAVSAALANLKG
jgi:F-type H+-transporting ATPase subunit b